MEIQTDNNTTANLYPDPGTLVMVRSMAAGVHFGTLAAVTDAAVRLTDARRVWSWESYSQWTLSELATRGRVTACKLGVAVDLTIAGWCEIVAMSTEAADWLIAANAWAT